MLFRKLIDAWSENHTKELYSPRHCLDKTQCFLALKRAVHTVSRER